ARLRAVRRDLDDGRAAGGRPGVPGRPGAGDRPAGGRPGPDEDRPRVSRRALFGVICAAVVALGAAYVGYAALRPEPSAQPNRAAVAAAAGNPQLQALLKQPHLVFLEPSGGDPTQDVVAVAPLEQKTTVRVETGLRCS